MPTLDAFLAHLSAPRTWPEVLAVAGLSVVLALLVHGVVVRVLRRVVARSPVASAALARTVVPGGWLLPLLALQAAWEAAPDGLPGLAIARHLTAIALIVAVAWTAIAAVGGLTRAIEVARPAHGPDDFGGRRLHTQIRVLARTAQPAV